MKKYEEFYLIKGEFSKEDAKEMLLTLISSKIQFHQSKNFSTNEIHGKNDENSIKRIPILFETMDKISEFITQINNDSNIHIEAQVKIEVK